MIAATRFTLSSSPQTSPKGRTLAPSPFERKRGMRDSLYKMMNRLSVLALAILTMAAITATAQENISQTIPTVAPDTELRHRFGVYGAYNLNFHTADFRKLPNIPNCCGGFTGGNGSGFTAGLLYEIPFASKLAVSLRLGYNSQNGLLFFDQRNDSSLVNIGGEPVQATFRHSLAAKLANLGFEPLLHFKPFDSFEGGTGGLIVSLGGRIGYVFQREYEQKEEITDPTDKGVFVETQRRTRNEFSGTLPDGSTLTASVLGGVSYELPLNRNGTVFLAPEIFYSFGLTPVVNGLTWRVNQLRFGIALKFAPAKKPNDPKPDPIEPPTPPKEPRETFHEPPPPTVVTPPSGKTDTLTASVTATAVEADGRELPELKFRIEEFLSDNLRPLLPYVFFDEGSATIPDRYERLSPKETKNFHVDKLHNLDIITTYRHLLNIVGNRMQKYKGATLTITGCNDFMTSEKGDLDVSYRRAEAVRSYLTKIWGIESTRLKLEARNLSVVPTVASTKNYQNEVNQENRRVELFSDTWEILEPVRTADTIRTVSPPVIRFRPVVKATNGVASWSMKAGQNNQTLKEFLGNGGDPPAQLDWEIASLQTNVPRASTPLEYTLSVTDNAGRTLQTTVGKAPVEQITIQRKRRERLNDKVIDRYSLILFDFDKATITEAHKRIIEYIKQQISPLSTVRIAGYTDYTNPADYAQKLSKSRAEVTARALGQDEAEVKGIGKNVLLYDNNVPEGRFYCRTVTIVVETPISAR